MGIIGLDDIVDELERVCKYCAWWGRDYEGVCDKITHNNARFRIDATADDDQGLDAKLVTEPNFSCCHFKKVEAKHE